MSIKPARDELSIAALLDAYRITAGDRFDLDAFASDHLPAGLPKKHDAKRLLAQGVARLAELQELLYANRTWSLLVVLQGMDAAGKDSTIKHVMSGVNPQGVAVTSFKAPGPEALAHDFLWRIHKAVPARGMIGVFNRSHYEDVLVARVHEDLVQKTGLPAALTAAPDFWQGRLADIAAFEAYLGRQGVRVIKVFLNLGRDAQKKRFLKRLDEPDKTWKFEAADVRERRFWPHYRDAYRAAIAATATPAAPWFVVPADHKWFARLVVVEAIIEALEKLDLKPPEVTDQSRAELDEARRDLPGDPPPSKTGEGNYPKDGGGGGPR